MQQEVVTEESLPGPNPAADEVTPPDTQGEPLIDEDEPGTEAPQPQTSVNPERRTARAVRTPHWLIDFVQRWK